VTQRICFDLDAAKDEDKTFDHVDDSIEFTPFSLDNIFDKNSILSPFANIDLNPLELSRSKVVLIHDAEVLSIKPAMRTKINLKSIVLNLSGTSTNLDPDGADILGINIPFGEFLNSGSFDTTYVDDCVRISRSRFGLSEQLRVFVRKEIDTKKDVEQTLDAEE